MLAAFNAGSLFGVPHGGWSRCCPDR